MIEEVNKIIYNMLISGRGVHLPDVGSLFIERQGARKISEDRLLSPRNVVAFSSREQAPSLIDEIVAIAGCAHEQAADIYARWIAKTRTEGVVTIGGVGELKGKSFVMEKSFNSAINPKGVKTLIIRRRSNGWLYAVCGVCVVLALCVCAYLMWGDKLLPKRDAVPERVELLAEQSEAEPAANAATAAEEVTSTDAPQAGAASQPSQPTPASQPSQAVQPAQVTAVQSSGQSATYAYYVVMGIFSTDANASRAIEQVRSKISNAACVVLPFKDKFMVTIYGSNSREECNTYARSYRDIYPDLWVYSTK